MRRLNLTQQNTKIQKDTKKRTPKLPGDGTLFGREGELLPALDYITRALDILLRACNVTVKVQLGKLCLNKIFVETTLLLPKWATTRFTATWSVAVLAWITVLYAPRIEYVVDYKVICSQLSESCECPTCLCFCSKFNFHHSLHPFLPLKRQAKIIIFINTSNMPKNIRDKKQKKYLKNPQKKEPSLLQKLKICQLPSRIYTSFQSIRLHVRGY